MREQYQPTPDEVGQAEETMGQDQQDLNLVREEALDRIAAFMKAHS